MPKNLSLDELCKLTDRELDNLLRDEQISIEEWVATQNKPLSKVLAEAIVDVFEDCLDQLDITLPDEFRQGNKEEARIYGDTYSNMIEEVISILKNYTDK